jgi:hypothetical protein
VERHVARIGHAGELAVDDLGRTQQHTDIEQRVDARLRGDEVRAEHADSRG